jgi:eukaryotic-like serine/threonine-protein kinase
MVVTAVMEPPGRLLQRRYRLDGRIAAGGMGEVWRATDLALGRSVAVKLLRPGYAANSEGLARFRAEARHAGSLSHPGIAQVYDYHEADPPYPPYLVMELVDGPSLARLLENGPVGPARTMSLIAQAARALAAAHAAGLVHRDIKPGNVLVSRCGQVKITDFGIARAAGSALLTRPGVLMGTPAYLAPEQAAGAPAGPPADLYALGIVAYHCLTGRAPFHGEPLAVALAHQLQPLPPLPPTVPAAVATLVADLTAKDPAERPASASEVAEQAERVQAALAATAGIARRLPARARAAGGMEARPPARPPPGRRTTNGTRRRKPNRRIAAGLLARAALALGAITAIAAAGWVVTGVHGATHPPAGPPFATQRPSIHERRSSHRVVRVGGPGRPNTAYSAGQGSRPTASSKAPAPSATPTPSRSATPTDTPTPTETSTPTGSPDPSVTPTSTGTPTTSGPPTASATSTASGTSTAAPSASPTSSPATARAA